MSKELTEKWKDGTLDNGMYYVVAKDEDGLYITRDTHDRMFNVWGILRDKDVKEVLAPVPSYNEVKEIRQKIERLEFDNEALEMVHNEGKEINAELVSKTDKLEKKLEIATKALKEYMTFCRHPAEEALKEMKGVK
jgi:hypothetical protein